jgi:hypothetical protein
MIPVCVSITDFFSKTIHSFLNLRKRQTDRFRESELSSLEKFKNKLIFATLFSHPVPAGLPPRDEMSHYATAIGHKQAHYIKLL